MGKIISHGVKNSFINLMHINDIIIAIAFITMPNSYLIIACNRKRRSNYV